MDESRVVIYRVPKRGMRRARWHWQVWEDRLNNEWPSPQMRAKVVRSGSAPTEEQAEADARAACSRVVPAPTPGEDD